MGYQTAVFKAKGGINVNKKILVITLACLLAASGFLLSSGESANAEFSLTPVSGMYVTDGTVRAVAYADGITYIGGNFTQVAPRAVRW